MKKGYTLPVIARHYRVSTEDLRRWNQIGRLTAGQKLVIQQQVAVKARAAVRKSKATKAAKPKGRPAATKPAQKTAPR